MKRRNIIPAHRRATWTVTLGLFWAVLALAAPAQAYHLDKKTQTIHIVSLQDFDRCQRDYESSGSEACLDALRGYVKKHPQDAFEAGKRARRHFMHWVALDFFALALDKRPSKERCADSDLGAAVISGLSLPPHYPAVAVAQRILREKCWTELQPAVSEELYGALSYFRNNTCPELSAKSVSTPPCLGLDTKPRAERSGTVAQLEGIDWRKLSIDPKSTELLRGPKGEEILLAHTVGIQPYVLVKFKGVRGPFNDHVLVALERSVGLGKDYVIAHDQSEWVVLTERAGQYQAFPKDSPAGFWANAARPANKETLRLPTRSEIAREFASAPSPGR